MNRNTIILIVLAAVVGVGVFMFTKKDSPGPTGPAASASSFPETSTGNPAVTNSGASAPVPTPTVVTIDPAQVKPVAGQALDVATVALEAKMISNAEALLAAGKPKEALKQIQDYELIPDRAALVPEAKFVKIEALSRVGGHKTDALAAAMQARTEPEMAAYLPRIDAVLADAGVTAGTTSASP